MFGNMYFSLQLFPKKLRKKAATDAASASRGSLLTLPSREEENKVKAQFAKRFWRRFPSPCFASRGMTCLIMSPFFNPPPTRRPFSANSAVRFFYSSPYGGEVSEGRRGSILHFEF